MKNFRHGLTLIYTVIIAGFIINLLRPAGYNAVLQAGIFSVYNLSVFPYSSSKPAAGCCRGIIVPSSKPAAVRDCYMIRPQDVIIHFYAQEHPLLCAEGGFIIASFQNPAGEIAIPQESKQTAASRLTHIQTGPQFRFSSSPPAGPGNNKIKLKIKN